MECNNDVAKLPILHSKKEEGKMRKFIFSGIIVGLVAAFLVVGLHKVLAQEKVGTPKPARVSVATPTCVVTPSKAYLTGSAKLVGGSADVKFQDKFSGLAADIKVIVTPVGSWSGIYVENVSPNGFTARSGAGNPDAKFNWLAVSK